MPRSLPRRCPIASPLAGGALSPRWRRWLLLGAVAGCFGGLACGGSSPPPGFGGNDTSAGGDDDARGGSSSPSGGDGGGSGSFADDDGGGPLLQGACLPGTYVGKFTCNVTAFFDLFKFPWGGDMAITFVGDQQQSGEFTTLTIAPGAHVSGTDDYQGAFSADLAGTLDCTTAKLTGALNNAQYIYDGADGGDGGFAIAFSGALSSDYSGGSSPPSFPHGVMGPLVPGAADAGGGNPLAPAATCTWSAALAP